MVFRKFLKKEHSIKQKRRHPRVALLPLHNVTYTRTDSLPPKQLQLANISLGGVGFLKNSSVNWPKSNGIIDGHFNFGSQAFDQKLRIAHTLGTIVGCEFSETSEVLQKQIQKYFNTELSALNMTRVNPEILKPDPDGTPHWFSGKNNCEVYFVAQNDRLVKFNISFFANYIEGGENLPTKFGQIADNNPDEKARYKSSRIIQWQNPFPEDLIAIMVRFIENIPDLPEHYKKAIAEKINSTH